MFDATKIWELIMIEPGHNFAVVLLLSGIWWESRETRKGLSGFKIKAETRLDSLEKTSNDHEVRLVTLEKN